MTPKFIVSHLDQQLGPFTEDELKGKWSAGEVLPIDYVFDDAKQDWVLLADRFSWAAKPVTDDGNAPPPIRDENILKRPPPTARISVEPARVSPPKASPAPAPAPLEMKDDDLGTKPDLVPAESVARAPVAAVTPTAAPAPQVAAPEGQVIKMVNGEAVIDFTPGTPGHLALEVKDTSDNKLRSAEPLKVTVKAAEPVEIRWEWPSRVSVGQDIEVKLRALDERGLVCAHYDDHYAVQVRGSSTNEIPVRLIGGQGHVKLNSTKTETWEIALQYSGDKKVRLPEASELHWLPGPAVRLVLDGPLENLAGESMKVRVKAVDAFGNTASTYQGTLALEVKSAG